MQLSLNVALLCLGQLAAAEQQTGTEGQVNLFDVIGKKHQQLRAADDEGPRGMLNVALQQHTPAAAAGKSARALRRDLGKTYESSIQAPAFKSNEVKEYTSLVNAVPAWYRNLGEADVYQSALTSEILSGDVSDHSARENKEPKLQGPDTSVDTPQAHLDRVHWQEGAAAQNRTSASQEVEEDNRTQEGGENSEESAGTKEPISAEDARGERLCDHLESSVSERSQPGYEKYNDRVTRGEVNGTTSHPSEGLDTVDPGTELVSGPGVGSNHASVAGEGMQSSLTVVDMQKQDAADAREAECGYKSSSEFRDLGRRRNYTAALPVKVPSVAAVSEPQQMPKFARIPAPAAPTKVLQPKQLIPPPKKVPTFKKVLPPPKKVHSVQKVYAPLKVVRTKKVVRPPKKYFAPKKVAYPKKKVPPKKVHTKYIFAQKKYTPSTKYVPAPKRFAPAPVYVPVPMKL